MISGDLSQQFMVVSKKPDTFHYWTVTTNGSRSLLVELQASTQLLDNGIWYD